MKYLSGKKYEVYMGMARNMAKLSPDQDTQVGSILLSHDGRIISSSFNGFSRGAPDEELPCTRGEVCDGGHDKYHYMHHAERNILYNCASQGIKTAGTTLICTLSPCLDCLRACYASGVEYIIFDELYSSFADIDFYKELLDITVYVDKNVMGTKFTCLSLLNKKEWDEVGKIPFWNGDKK